MVMYLLTAAYCGLTVPLIAIPVIGTGRCEASSLLASWFLAVALAWATYLRFQHLGWIE